MAVLPSPDNATDQPCRANPAAPVPTSLGPCCVNCAGASCDEKRRPAKIRKDANTLEQRAVTMAPWGVAVPFLDNNGQSFTNPSESQDLTRHFQIFRRTAIVAPPKTTRDPMVLWLRRNQK